jgi:hypothetical protein
VPAGIFAPSLAIGAALGNDIALLLQYPHASALIALGMVGFLAAATAAHLLYHRDGNGRRPCHGTEPDGVRDGGAHRIARAQSSVVRESGAGAVTAAAADVLS